MGVLRESEPDRLGKSGEHVDKKPAKSGALPRNSRRHLEETPIG